MTRRGILATAVLLTTVVGCRSEPVAPPQIAFEVTAADVGSIDQGAEMSADFAFVNLGGTDLAIDSVGTACDCQASVTPNEATPPGQRGAIRLICSTHEMAGSETRTATVYSSDSAHPTVSLTLRADVAARIALEPKEIYVGKIRRGEKVVRRVRLRRASDDRPVLEYGGGILQMTFEVEPKSPQTGVEEIHVEIAVLDDAPLGRFREQIVIAPAAGAPSLMLPVVGHVEGDLTLSPARLAFDAAGNAAREVVLHNGGERGIEPPRVTRQPDWTLVTIEELKPGFDYRVVARLKPPVPHGRVEDSIELETTHAEEQGVTIPVVATGKAKEG